MKKRAKILYGILKWLAILVGVGVLVADFYCEVYGLPDNLSGRLVAALRDQGIHCEFGQLRAGVVRGIRGRNVRIRVDDPGGRIELRAENLGLRVYWGALLFGRLQLASATFTGATLTARPAGQDETAALHLTRMGGTIRAADDLSYRVQVTAEGYGIHVETTGNIRGIEDAGPAMRRSASNASSSAGPRPWDLTWIKHLVSALDKSAFSDRGGFVKLHVETDLEDLRQTSVQGRFDAAEVLFGDLVLRRITGAFSYRDQRITLSQAAVMVSDDELVRGKLVYNTDSGLVNGEIQGRLRPLTAARLAGSGRLPVVERLALDAPMRIQATLHPSPREPSEWFIEGECESAAVRFRRLPIRSARAKITFRHRMLSVADFKLQVETPEATEEVSGSLTWWPWEQAVAGEVRVRARIPLRMEQAGLPLPSWLRDAGATAEPVAIDAVLEKSPFDWRRFKLTGTLAAEGMRAGGVVTRQVRANLAMAESRLRLTEVKIGFPGTPSDTISGMIEADFRTLASEDRLRVSLAVDGKGKTGQGTWAEGFSVSGSLILRPVGGTLTGDLSGTAFPGRTYRAFQNLFRLPPSKIMRRISCENRPARVELHLPETTLPLRDWRLAGRLQADQAKYATLPISTIRSDVALTRHSLRFDGIEAEIADGVRVALDLALAFKPIRLEVTDLAWTGDPGVAVAFIGAPRAREIYLAVWKQLEWAEQSPPNIRLKRLVYERGAYASDWSLVIDSRIAARGAVYRGLSLGSLEADVRVSLPGDVRLENVTISTETMAVEGSARIQTEGTPFCKFSLKHLSGGADPRQIIQLLNPDWDSFFQDFSFSAYSSVNCSGSFFFGQDPRLRLEGRITTPSCTVRKLRFEDVDMRWKLDGGVVGWDVTKASLFGGEALLTGAYDTTTRSGSLAISLERTDLWAFAQALGVQNEDFDIGAVLDGNCRLQFYRGWAGASLQLSGNGRVRIGGSDLWKIPILGSLGQLLNRSFLRKLSRGWLSQLGNITQLDALLDFKGGYVLVPRLETNGTVLSLKGEGEYSWENDRIRFNVTGETLKKAGLLNLALKPLSLVFNAELRGPAKDAEWHLVSSLRRVITGGEETFEGGENP